MFDSVKAVPGIDVGWNEVINYPGKSLVQDNILVFRTSGTANLPLEIHDTYIQGAYPAKASDAFSGGGIKVDNRPNDSAVDASAFNDIHDNQVVGTGSYGIEFLAGHDNVAANNRVVGSGLLPDGSKLSASFVGIASAAPSDEEAGSTYSNTMHDNVVGWSCWNTACASVGFRNDQYFPAAPSDYSANSVITDPQVTRDLENNEYQVWQDKLSANAVTIGPSF
jgi:hypothetical protein